MHCGKSWIRMLETADLQRASVKCHTRRACSDSLPKINCNSAYKSSLLRLERCLSGLCLHLSGPCMYCRNQTYTVTSATTVTGSVFMRRFRLFWDSVEIRIIACLQSTASSGTTVYRGYIIMGKLVILRAITSSRTWHLPEIAKCDTNIYTFFKILT